MLGSDGGPNDEAAAGPSWSPRQASESGGVKEEAKGFYRLWVLAAIAWGGISALVMSEYIRIGDRRYVQELGFLLSLLWVQFPFAALFQDLRMRGGRNVGKLLPVLVLPPLLLGIVLLVLD